ncbi:MAG TPA: hypothetical protein VGL23_14395, partial [Chloroflexota bacterium]
MQRPLLRASLVAAVVAALLLVAEPADRVLSQTSTLTVTRQVGASADDAYQEGGAYAGSATALWLGNGGAQSYTGLRFTGLAVPPGA